MFKKWFFFICTLFFIALIFIAILALNFSSLKEDYATLDENHSSLLSSYASLEADFSLLSKTHTSLESNYNSLHKEYSSLLDKLNNLLSDFSFLESDYISLSSDYLTLSEEVGIFKKKIEESMAWFKTNSSLDSLSSNSQRQLKNSLRKCLSCYDSYCYIKSSCVKTINSNENYFGITYAEDIKTSNTEDKLQSIEQFFSKRKGDCEDFSLFYAAELRYLIDYVYSLNKTPIIEAIIESNTRKGYDVVDGWHYSEGLEAKRLPEDYIHPYVACGHIYDPNKEDVGGHCLIMFSKEKITSEEDIKNIQDVFLLEPQNGLFSETVYNHGTFSNYFSETEIFEIITDSDYYINGSFLFDDTSLVDEWYSYGYYYNKILSLEK